MLFTQAELEEFEDIAQRFVGAFVKKSRPESKLTVCGIECNSIEQAVDLAMKKCAYPAAAARGPPEMAERILREKIAQAIENQQ